MSNGRRRRARDVLPQAACRRKRPLASPPAASAGHVQPIRKEPWVWDDRGLFLVVAVANGRSNTVIGAPVETASATAKACR
jgi:hypothetical protein